MKPRVSWFGLLMYFARWRKDGCTDNRVTWASKTMLVFEGMRNGQRVGLRIIVEPSAVPKELKADGVVWSLEDYEKWLLGDSDERKQAKRLIEADTLK